MTTVPKNRHIEAATAILGSTQRAKALLFGLAKKPSDSYQFLANGKKTYVEGLLLLQNAGHSTTFLASSPSNSEQVSSIAELITKGLAATSKTQSRLAQAIMGTQDPLLREAFEKAGFTPLSTLHSMEASTGTPPNTSMREPNALEIISLCDSDDHTVKQALESTYIGSLDCPGIHGIRPTKDVIAGHRDTEHYDEAFWFIAKLENSLVGVVLLTPVLEARCINIAYLGVSPDFRGKGIGDSLVRHTFAIAKELSCIRISLAVDANNTPANGLYTRWNFRTIGQRFTMIKKLY